MENYNNDNSALMNNDNSAKQPLTEKHINNLAEKNLVSLMENHNYKKANRYAFEFVFVSMKLLY